MINPKKKQIKYVVIHWLIWFVASMVIKGIYFRITALPSVQLSHRETTLI